MRPLPVRPTAHLLLGALDEAAMLVARADDPAARAEVTAVLAALLDGFAVERPVAGSRSRRARPDPRSGGRFGALSRLRFGPGFRHDPTHAPAALARFSKLEQMKAGIHPEYTLANVHCSCGNQFYTRSTKDDLHVELCSECHPFYTGKQKLVDTGGRVERFQRRAAKHRAGK